MKYNKKGFSLVFALGLTILVTLLAFAILQYLIPFSKNIRGIEQSAFSYYQGYSGVEQALQFKKDNPGVGIENTENTISSNKGYEYSILALGDILPTPGEGGSEYDRDWNELSPGNPIQLDLDGIDLDWGVVNIYFRVPDLNGDSIINQTLSGSNLHDVVQWQLSGAAGTLLPDSSFINASDVCASNDNCDRASDDINLGAQQGIDKFGNTGVGYRFSQYYDDNCESGNNCIVKFSLIGDLQTTSGVQIPYLEWKIDFGGQQVPLRYMTISSQGESLGFSKKIDIRIPQQTVSEVFDFTIFQ